MSSTTTTAAAKDADAAALAQHQPTLYFAYGSNLWLDQMARRCPTASYLGIARLRSWRWIINGRGYANIVQVDSDTASVSVLADAPQGSHAPPTVFGMVYTLLEQDEASLDVYEGVPLSYTKEYVEVDFWPAAKGWVNIEHVQPQRQQVLAYVDRLRVTEGPPKLEYISRMNSGLKDAVDCGVPISWVNEVVRKSIPAPESTSSKEQ